jgi:predicted Zn-dependent protease
VKCSMYKTISLILISLILTACASSPTGRSQLKIFPNGEMERMGIASYNEMKQQTPILRNRQVNNYVVCVANAITRELNSSGDWEVNVFDDDAINAFALPGGKIGVYTGILEVAATQDQLAAVVGHEVAHVIADHGNERVSVAYATQSGLQLAESLAGSTSGTKSQLLGLLGVGAQIGIILPYGRTQESEADLLGIDYMAQAGFDPRQSVQLWQNMAAAGGGQPPEFMSTHPSHTSRINELNASMENAMNLYRQAQSQGKRPNCK